MKGLLRNKKAAGRPKPTRRRELKRPTDQGGRS